MAYDLEIEGLVRRKQLSRVLSIGQRMRRGCGVSFHQLRTCPAFCLPPVCATCGLMHCSK
jgi:hypothetical protein